MELLTLERYNWIMDFLNIAFGMGVVLFFLKEFTILFGWSVFVLYIRDYTFFLLFLMYAIFYITPFFYPELVKGFVLPDPEPEEEEIELTPEEKELRELEKISL